MTTAAHGSTNPAAGVMTTRPATSPVAAPTSVGLPARATLDEHPRHEPCARRHHGVHERKRRHAVGGELGARIEADQPNHKSVAPNATNGTLCGR